MAKTKKSSRSRKAAGDATDAKLTPAPSPFNDILELQRTRVVCGPDGNMYTSSNIGVGNDSGSIEDFAKDFAANLKLKVRKYDDMVMEFEVEGISCSIANALRRVMIAEVPTMAIEHVFVVNNTSIIQDEVLAHRLGMIPLRVDPRLFEFKKKADPKTHRNTAVMKMDVTCEGGEGKVFSDSLVWLSTGSEMPEETGLTGFEGDQRERIEDGLSVVHDDILVAKLRSKQCIKLECHCVKGVGEEHAKWSPVATAWYKLYPEVVLLRKASKSEAEVLCGELPGLVYEEDGVLRVDDAIEHPKLLEKVRRMSGEDEYKDLIQLRKRKDKFVFTIESTGAYKPHEIWKEAVDRLQSKCDKVLEGLAQG
mmetsp:Transcript_836/g.2302  ORF Transcript_836/g.2302 Transcript_836/m.2302 type:complete len:365 (+) Transcript_836:232-1326(+)